MLTVIRVRLLMCGAGTVAPRGATIGWWRIGWGWLRSSRWSCWRRARNRVPRSDSRSRARRSPRREKVTARTPGAVVALAPHRWRPSRLCTRRRQFVSISWSAMRWIRSTGPSGGESHAVGTSIETFTIEGGARSYTTAELKPGGRYYMIVLTSWSRFLDRGVTSRAFLVEIASP